MANNLSPIIGKISVRFAGSFFVCLVRFFWRIKTAEVFAFAGYFNPRPPFLIGRNKRNAFVTSFISGRNFSICTILLLGNFSQIIHFIVRGVTVNMVNMFFWPFPGNKQPSKSVGIIQPVVYTNSNVSIGVNASCQHSLLPFAASINFPCKFARFRVIFQKFANSVSRSFVFHFQLMSYNMTFVK